MFLFNFIPKVPSFYSNNFLSLTGNVALDFNDLSVGDDLQGKIILNDFEKDSYGIVMLSKNGDSLYLDSFNLQDLSIEKNHGNKFVLEMSDLVNYTFKEEGEYELFLSLLDLEVNIKKEIIVN